MERRDPPSVAGGFVTSATTTAASEKRGAQTESAAAETADRRDGKDSFQKVAAPCRAVLLRAYFGGSTILLI